MQKVRKKASENLKNVSFLLKNKCKPQDMIMNDSFYSEDYYSGSCLKFQSTVF